MQCRETHQRRSRYRLCVEAHMDCVGLALASEEVRGAAHGSCRIGPGVGSREVHVWWRTGEVPAAQVIRRGAHGPWRISSGNALRACHVWRSSAVPYLPFGVRKRWMMQTPLYERLERNCVFMNAVFSHCPNWLSRNNHQQIFARKIFGARVWL